VNVLVWHLHGSWMTAFVQGRHRYLVPALPARGRFGLGRSWVWEWPPSVVEVTPSEAAKAPVDVVVLQRTEELEGLAEAWLGGRRPGMEVPAIYVEHNAPQGRIDAMRHPAAGRRGLTVVHVTHFNQLFWDCRDTPTRVIEHGVLDPGYSYTGELPRGVAAINDPLRRNRVVGLDVLERLRETVPIDLFGIGTRSEVPQQRLHEEMPRRRVYVHTCRWTSLGLSLVEAMHLGLPVVALATTEVPVAVPPEAGVVSNRLDTLADALQWLVTDPEAARRMGQAGRRHARRRYGLERFLNDWDRLLEETAS
jgi:glycosyltransferase involved in cell wall biosynthesis